nr:TA system VapC family ribonuclease toxin [Oscillatoria laete-virens]
MPDINVIFPLLVSRHAHRAAAVEWFDRAGIAEVALCRLTRLGVLRLLCTEAVMGPDVLRPEAALDALEILENDERIVIAPEPPDLDRALRECVMGRMSSPNLWSDAYLAAFALAGGVEVVSFDKGFKRFSGLRFCLL